MYVNNYVVRNNKVNKMNEIIKNIVCYSAVMKS